MLFKKMQFIIYNFHLNRFYLSKINVIQNICGFPNDFEIFD